MKNNSKSNKNSLPLREGWGGSSPLPLRGGMGWGLVWIALLMLPVGLMAQTVSNVVVNIENQQVAKYLADAKRIYKNAYDSNSIVTAYMRTGDEYRDDLAAKAMVTLPDGRTADCRLVLTLDSVAIDTIPVTTDMQTVAVGNLIPKRNYTYSLEDAGGTVLQIGTITVEGTERMLCFEGIRNLRDIGGWTTAELGTVRYGLVYRGPELTYGTQWKVDSAVVAEMKRVLNIGAELDIRDFLELDIPEQSAFGPDVRYMPVKMEQVANTFFDQKEAFAKAFHFLLDNLRDGIPTYVHCLYGADRTGKFCAMIEGLINMRIAEIYKEYELTSFSNIDGKRVKLNLNRSLYYFEDKFPLTKDIHTTMTDYALNTLGITQEEIDELCRLLVEPFSYPISVTAPVYHRTDDEVFTLEGIKRTTSQPGISIIRQHDGTVRKVVHGR